MPGGQSGREVNLSLSPYGQPGLVYVLSPSCEPHDTVSGFADTQTMLSDDSSPLVGTSSGKRASIPDTPLLLHSRAMTPPNIAIRKLDGPTGSYLLSVPTTDLKIHILAQMATLQRLYRFFASS